MGRVQAHIGVHPYENTTMNRKMKTIPAFALAAPSKLLNRPTMMAKMQTMVAVAPIRILRRPNRSTVKDPYGVIY